VEENMARSFAQCFGVLVIAALACAVCWGQAASTAQISGTVKDQTGALLPGVEVTATQTDTGLKRTGLTDETGSYILQNLPIGPYRLEAALTGFSTYAQSGIVLQVNSNPQINPVLQVGQVTEQIEVQANASLVETRSSGVGQIIDNQRVLELPLNGRQPTELIMLTGMAVRTNTAGSLATPNRNYPTVTISIAGGMLNGVTYILDGGNHNDPFNNLNLPLPFPDALQEFKVETSALPAQYGHHSAAAINAVTKSGTNQFHGNLFEFFRNGAMNARNTFAVTPDGLKRNQFGGTVGGPIVSNKLFFFGGFQGTKSSNAPTTIEAFVPTAQMLAGDFTAFASAACSSAGRATNLSAPFVGNRISPALFAAPAVKLSAILPKTSDPCGSVRFGRRDTSSENLYVGRVDYQVTEKHSLFGRINMARYDKPYDFDGENVLTLANGPLAHRVYSFVLGDTYLLGPQTVSSFRATLNRTNISRQHGTDPKFLGFTDLGIQTYEPIPRAGAISVTNGFSSYLGGGGNNAPGHYNTTSFQFAEDLAVVRGRHQIGFGGTYIRQMINSLQNVFAVPSMTFTGQVTGLGLADFLIGKAASMGGGEQHATWNRSNYIGLYLQDSWKMTPRFVVNAGVRWEPFLPQWSKVGRNNHFEHAFFDQGVKSKVFPFAPIGVLFAGDQGMPKSGAVGFGSWADFAPRIGFAWDPRGNGSISIRAAYGIFFDYPHLYNYLAFSQGPPWGPTATVPFPASMERPWDSYPGGNPFPTNFSNASGFTVFPNWLTIPQKLQHPYMNQWNFSVQQALGQNTVLSANYVGNNTIHLQTQKQLNEAVLTPGATLANINQRRILYLKNPQQGQYYGNIWEQDQGGTNTYEALVVSLQSRTSKGFTVQANHTWSHCIGDRFAPGFGPGAGANAYVFTNNRKLDRADCLVDVRQVFNASTVYATPQFSNSWLRMLASNWQVSGIIRLQSGGPLSIVTGVDTALTGQTLQRAVQQLDDPYASTHNIDGWINPAAFRAPATGTYSDLGINTLRGPGGILVDAGVTRSFKIREAQSIQFRVEAFNLPNHVNPGNPITTLNSQQFGKIVSAGDPRIMQLALKYVF
jgi:hypothetical protein